MNDDEFADPTLAEAQFWRFTQEVGEENLASAYMKLELGIATPEEQRVMAQMLVHIKALLFRFY